MTDDDKYYAWLSVNDFIKRYLWATGAMPVPARTRAAHPIPVDGEGWIKRTDQEWQEELACSERQFSYFTDLMRKEKLITVKTVCNDGVTWKIKPKPATIGVLLRRAMAVTDALDQNHRKTYERKIRSIQNT